MPDTKKLLKRGFEFALKPLVDIPTLPGGAVGRAVEGALEGATSPVGMLSLALMPASLGTSFGLRGGAAVASRLGTRAATEFATASAGGMAAEEVSKRVQDQPGVIKYGAPLLAGFTGSAATLGGLNRAGLAATRMPPVDRLGTPSVQEAVPTTAITYPAVGKVPEQTLPVSTGKKNILDLLNLNALLGDMPMSSLTPGIRAIVKTPSYMLDDLGMTVAKGEVYRNVLGEQNSATSVVTLFKDVMAKHPDDARETIIHELIHHKQQYLTPREIKNLSAQWKTQVKPAYDRFEGKVDKLVSRHNLDVPTTDTIEDKIDAIKKFIVDKDNTPEGTKLANSWDVLEGETDYAVRGGPQEWLAVTGAQRALARIEGTYSPNSPIRGLLQQYRTFIGGVDPAAQYRALDAMDNPNVVRARNAPAKATASGGRKMAIRANPGEATIKLYRGDRLPTGNLSMAKTSPLGALGQGFYFSTNPKVATKYSTTSFGGRNPDTIVEDFYNSVAQRTATGRLNKQVPGSDWGDTRTSSPQEYARALAEARQAYPNVSVSKYQDGHLLSATGTTTTLDMPKSVLKSTIASNATIPEELWNKIALAVNKTAGKKVVDLYDSDAPGEHTLMGAMSFGKHAAPTNSTPDLKLRISTAVRRVLSDEGYTGVNYPLEGSTAYVFWDEQAIQRLQKGLPLKPPSVRRMEADAPKPSRAEEMAAARAEGVARQGAPVGPPVRGSEADPFIKRGGLNPMISTRSEIERELDDIRNEAVARGRGAPPSTDFEGLTTPMLLQEESTLTQALKKGEVYRPRAAKAAAASARALGTRGIPRYAFGTEQEPDRGPIIPSEPETEPDRGPFFAQDNDNPYRDVQKWLKLSPMGKQFLDKYDGSTTHGDYLHGKIAEGRRDFPEPVVQEGRFDEDYPRAERPDNEITSDLDAGMWMSRPQGQHLYKHPSDWYYAQANQYPGSFSATETMSDPVIAVPRLDSDESRRIGAHELTHFVQWTLSDYPERLGLTEKLSLDNFYKEVVNLAPEIIDSYFQMNRKSRYSPNRNSTAAIEDLISKINGGQTRKRPDLMHVYTAVMEAYHGDASSMPEQLRRFYPWLNQTADGPRYAFGTGTPAWQRKEGQNPKGGLNAVGRASAKAGGHNLKPPVKAGDNPRRASFLARMGGMPGPEREPDGEPTRLLLSLQAWGASSKSDAKSKARAISARNKSK